MSPAISGAPVTHSNYEALREQVLRAVEGALPTDPDDGTCVVRYSRDDETGGHGGSIPVWGAPEVVVNEITTAVMAALFPAPVTIPLAHIDEINSRIPRTWGCGCSTDQCRIEWGIYRDGGPDPTSVWRATCYSHGVYGDSKPGKQGDGMRQRAQALIELSSAHEEQCR